MANSALLTIGAPLEVTVTVFFAVCSMVAMGIAVQGYCFMRLDVVSCLLFLAVSLGLVAPALQWNAASLVLGAALGFYCWFRSRPRRIVERIP